MPRLPSRQFIRRLPVPLWLHLEALPHCWSNSASCGSPRVGGAIPLRVGRAMPRLGNRANPEAPSVFVLDDVEEQDFWDRARAVRRRFTRNMSSALFALNADLGEIGQVCHILPQPFQLLPLLH